MNPGTPLALVTVLVGLVGATFFVLYWHYRETIGSYASRRASGVLRYTIPAGVVLSTVGAVGYLALVGQVDQSSTIGPLSPLGSARGALAIWLVGVASVVLTLVVLLADVVGGTR